MFVWLGPESPLNASGLGVADTIRDQALRFSGMGDLRVWGSGRPWGYQKPVNHVFKKFWGPGAARTTNIKDLRSLKN